MRIHWVFADDALRAQVEPLGYPAASGPGVDVLHVACLPADLTLAAAQVRAARRGLPADAALLAAGRWTEPAEVEALLAAGADDYVLLEGETRALAVRLLSWRHRSERMAAAHPLSAQLQHAQRLETLGAISNRIAHDFNNLLAAIQGNAELALMGRDLAEPLRYSLAQIDKTAQRAGDLTRQMLAYARNRVQGVEALSLNELLREMEALLASTAPGGGTLKLNLGRNVPPVSGRANDLRQLLLNLVWNACEAQPGGEVQVRTSFDDEAEPPLVAQVVLEVEDAGPGVPEDARARLFDPLYSTKGAGRGLGLAAAQAIAAAHGGRIEVHSGRSGGACFRVLLPPIDDWRIRRADAAQPERAPATILLIEPERALREAAERLLRRAGYTVFATEQVAEGLSLCEQLAVVLDAVILDPGPGGRGTPELIQAIHALSAGLRVVVWSGQEEPAVRALLAGAEPYDFLQRQPQMSVFIADLDELVRPPASG